MIIRRISKCVWCISGVRYETWRKARAKGNIYKGMRRALFDHVTKSNPKLTPLQIDKMVVKLMNKHVKAREALEYQTLVI